MRPGRTIIAAIVIASLTYPVLAQTPLGTAFTYQGRLNQANQPYNGSANLVFNLYDDPNVGNLLGTQTLNGVVITGGLFTVVLNGAGEFGATAFNGERRWLEISVNGTPLSPRQELTAGPYALFSKDSGQLAGQPAQYYLDAGHLNAGTLAPARGGTGIDTSAAVAGSLLTTSGVGAWSLLGPGADSQVLTLAGGVPTWGNPSGFTLPYSGSANVPSPNAVFQLTNTNASNGSTLWCETDGTNGIGVYGNATATTGYAYGGLFQSASPDGRAVFGQNTATTGWALGGRFGSASPDGRAVYATASAASGVASGVYGESLSTSGIGVYGAANAASGFTVAGYFLAHSPSAYGVYAEVTATTGGNVGVGGRTNDLNTGYGVVSYGRFAATGTKSFRIDHPFDPENKYLSHYCSEGPEPYNVYKGRVTTDAQGYAWAGLPDYFEEINRDFDYQLTLIDDSDDFVLAKVTREVVDHRFQIRTNKPNVKVCWEVKAVRNDLFVRTYGAPVEVQKQGAEKGTYQHPELYGQPAQKGMNYHAEHERPSPAAPLERTPR